ncbi:MAG: hypothetical protein K8R41_10185 [Bacteroidales bacterium]|nr:hypothetical protein [Bacteroidales bacterium]
MNKKIKLLAILFISLFIFGCNSQNVEGFDYGRVENNKYLNSFFDFEISIPPTWVVQTKEQTDNLVEVGENLIAGDDENMKAIIKASEINSANLLVVFKYEVGSPVEYNPSFVLIAENLKNAPGVKKGSDYLFHARKLLLQSQVQHDYIDEEFKKEIINNQEFYLMNSSINYAGFNIKQVYYTTIKNGFSVNAIITYVNEEQKNELEKVINSLIFDK